MLKRLSMVLAATAVMGVCMAMMPQKVEGAFIDSEVYHSHFYESGKSRVHNKEKEFTQYSNPYTFYLGWVNGGRRWCITKMNCGNGHAFRKRIKWWGWQTVTFRVHPYKE
jgi:hypothetical protein